MIRACVVGLLTVLAAAACATTTRSAAQELTGCWYFDRDASADGPRLPWGVRLGEEALEGWPALQQRQAVREALTLTPSGEEDHPFGYWILLEGDSIEIGYPAGGGLVLRLAHEGPRLEGTARPVGDVVRPGESRRVATPVALVRALCPDEEER